MFFRGADGGGGDPGALLGSAIVRIVIGVNLWLVIWCWKLEVLAGDCPALDLHD